MIVLLIASVLLFGCYSWFTVWCRSGLLKLSYQPASRFSSETGVSVIIPFRNEALVIGDIIEDLKKQSHPNFEVIFVNDHSEDAFLPFFEEVPENFRLIHLEKGEGKKAAIAKGIAAANGSIILQTDADCYLPPAWVESLLAQFNPNTSVVCGAVRMVPYSNFWSKFAALDFLSLQASGIGSIANGQPFMASAASLGYRKEFYQSSMHLHPQRASGDDVFLIQEAVQRGKEVKAVCALDATVRTHAAPDLKSFLKQRIRWGAKTSDYSSGFAKAIAALVLLMACCQIGWIVYSILNPWGWLLVAAFYLIKMVADFRLLHQFALQSGGTDLLKSFFTVSLLYPFYILATSFMIFTFPQSWKGRRIN